MKRMRDLETKSCEAFSCGCNVYHDAEQLILPCWNLRTFFDCMTLLCLPPKTSTCRLHNLPMPDFMNLLLEAYKTRTARLNDNPQHIYLEVCLALAYSIWFTSRKALLELYCKLQKVKETVWIHLHSGISKAINAQPAKR